jgi:hypothetical protein
MVSDAVGAGFREPISGKFERRHRVYTSQEFVQKFVPLITSRSC